MKFRLFLRSFENEKIAIALESVRLNLLNTECQVTGTVALPMRIKKFCVLRSPHVDKDSREQFEVRLFKRFVDIVTDSPIAFDLLLKTELPPGLSCSLKVLDAN